MKLFENKVGRPSNETIKKRKIFIFVSIFISLLFIFGITFMLYNITSRKLKGYTNNFTFYCPTTVNVNEEFECETNTSGVKITATKTNLSSKYNSSFVTYNYGFRKDLKKQLKYTKEGSITVTASKNGNEKKKTVVIQKKETNINLWCDKYTYNINEEIKCYTNQKNVTIKATANNLVNGYSSSQTISNGVKKLKYNKSGTIKVKGSKNGYKSGEKTIDIVNDEYDLVLFWGQSNMVGFVGNKKINNVLEINAKDDRTGLDGFVDYDILDNYKAYGKVDVKIPKGAAYEYKLYNDNGIKNERLESIDDGSVTGENLAFNDNKLYYEYWYNNNFYCTSNGKNNAEPCPGYDNTNEKYSLQQSKGTNMIPYFVKTYYEMTGRKLIVVFGAYGGSSISEFLPASMIKDDQTINGHNYTYEAMKQKYDSAINYLNRNGYKIGRKFYVAMQGEENAVNRKKMDVKYLEEYYKDMYMKVHKNLKSVFGMEFGILNETSGNLQYKTSYDEGVKAVNDAQEYLINNNNDIYRGSKLAYNVYINNNTKAFSKVSDNTIHLTSASLSQIGKDSAKTATIAIKNITTDSAPYIVYSLDSNKVKINVRDSSSSINVKSKIQGKNNWNFDKTYVNKNNSEVVGEILLPSNGKKVLNEIYAKDKANIKNRKVIRINQSGNKYSINNSPNITYVYNNGNSVYFFLEDGTGISDIYFRNSNDDNFNTEKIYLYKSNKNKSTVNKAYFSVNLKDFTYNNNYYYGYVKSCDKEHLCSVEEIKIKK